jgi:hypothetical protein
LELLHNTECDFYDSFKEVENFAIPKVFYTQKFLVDKEHTGVILMEDLSERTKTLDIHYPLNLEQV